MFLQMPNHIFYFLRMIGLADHHHIPAIHNDHVLHTDGYDQAIAIPAINKGVVCFVCQMQAAIGGDIAIHIRKKHLKQRRPHRLERQAPPDVPSSGRLSRQVKHFPIKVEANIRPDDKGAHFVLSLTAADRPGLLYTVATALAEHGANLHTAKITTLGERVEDVFLISGGDLRQSSRRIQLETELMERLKIQS